MHIIQSKIMKHDLKKKQDQITENIERKLDNKTSINILNLK